MKSYIHDPYGHRHKARLEAQPLFGITPAPDMPAPETNRSTLTSAAIYDRRAQQRRAGAPQHGLDLKDFGGLR
jgi:hypothetical protein